MIQKRNLFIQSLNLIHIALECTVAAAGPANLVKEALLMYIYIYIYIYDEVGLTFVARNSFMFGC